MQWTEDLYRSAFGQHGSFQLRENGEAVLTNAFDYLTNVFLTMVHRGLSGIVLGDVVGQTAWLVLETGGIGSWNAEGEERGVSVQGSQTHAFGLEARVSKRGWLCEAGDRNAFPSIDEALQHIAGGNDSQLV